MASARRIALHLSTALKQRRRIDLSTNTAMLKQWKCPFINCDKNIRHLSTDTASNDYDYFREIGYTDVADLLSTPQRDFLLRSHNGQKVPVSSLKGKLVGWYLCEYRPKPPRMEAIKKVYEEAKSRGYDFEIVQITFDFYTKRLGTNPIVEKFSEDVLWLTLPSVDPSFSKIQRIFECGDHTGDAHWPGDSLVLIHPPQAEAGDGSGFFFEFSGAEILEQWGIEGYPFTRQSLYKVEYELQKREATLQWFFPPGESLLLRPRPGGDGIDLIDAFSQLSRKRVLVLFASYCFGEDHGKFLSMLRSEYEAQLEDNVAEESKFEVVYVSTQSTGLSSFDVFSKGMPWLVQPFPSDAHRDRLCKVFKLYPSGSAAVAFNEQGEFIAKEDRLNGKKECDNPQFPFIDQDLEKHIRLEVEELCNSRR